MQRRTRALRGWLVACALSVGVAACGKDAGGGPLSVADLDDGPDTEVLDLAASVPPELVPADLAFEETVRTDLAPGERLRRFLLRFHAALRHTYAVAQRVGNEEAEDLVEDAYGEYRIALRLFRAHEPREALAHLRAAARILAEARSILREELAEDRNDERARD